MHENKINYAANKRNNKNQKKKFFTLEIKHKEMLEKCKFNKKNNKTLIKKLHNTTNDIIKLDNLIYNNELSNIDNIENYKKKSKMIKEKININTDLTKNSNTELDYYNNVGDLIMEYYKIKDDENNINENKETKNLIDFLQMPNNTTIENKILDNYYTRIDGIKIYKDIGKNRIKYCSECNIEKILDIVESSYICQLCGSSEIVIIDEDKQIKDYSPYKRLNHFKEWLEQLQAKQTPDIPEQLFDEIINELIKNRIYDLSILTKDYIKKILKKLNYNSYYEHIIYIINKLNNIPPPKLSKDMEKIFNSMFNQIQEPWELYKPKYRKNFLSYSYVLYKFCEILNLKHLLKYFSLHKDYNKIRENDEIWKKICNHLNWTYNISYD